MHRMHALKKVFIAGVSFFVPFLIFVFLLHGTVSENLFYSPFLYLLFTIIASVLSFVISYLTYQMYIRDRDVRMFVAALAFCIFGLVFFSDIVSTSNLFNKEAFEVIEHYGMLAGALVLSMMAVPASMFTSAVTFVYHRRVEVFLGVILCVLIFPVTLFFLPSLVATLGSSSYVVTIITGVVFLVGLGLLLTDGENETSALSPYLIVSFSLFICAAIIPLFYTHWNLLWWYFNIITFIGFAAFFVGVVREESVGGVGSFC
ncbi:MAG: hypothetical protein WAW90_01110 [Minisyncoccia bacterium]